MDSSRFRSHQMYSPKSLTVGRDRSTEHAPSLGTPEFPKNEARRPTRRIDEPGGPRHFDSRPCERAESVILVGGQVFTARSSTENHDTRRNASDETRRGATRGSAPRRFFLFRAIVRERDPLLVPSGGRALCVGTEITDPLTHNNTVVVSWKPCDPRAGFT